MTILRKTLLVVTIATLTAGAHAGILIDRGLPTSNLNNAAGANRSNVAWAFPADAMGTWVVGDTFTNSSAFNYHIDNIRVWLTGASYDASSLRLLGGLNGSVTFTTLSTSAVPSNVTYAGGASYQTTSGSFIPLTQVDFAVSGLTLGAGETYDFFVQGTSSSGATPYVFLHASNAALSGSTQQGSDGVMLAGIYSGGAVSSVETWTSAGNGWDKASDINVQVFGTVPDAGSTVLLIGLALTGLGLVRRRFAA